MDALYSYDGLQQVTSWKRGNLSPGSGPPYTGVTSKKQGEDFTYDQTGNWLGDVSDNPNFTQSRAHNVNNQITSITGPTGVVQPAYDAAGNMTLAPSPSSWTAGYTYKWDAWNRLVEIKQGGTVIGGYAYDALTRRTRKTVGGVTRDIYYDRQWRSVEEREGATVKVQHAWSPLDRWTLIRRKRNASGSTLNETLFCLRDYLDPVALANTSGAVVERYNYDAFGTVRIMSAAYGVRGSSSYDWEFLYHGEFRDKESELYNYGYRYLDTQLGRWLSRDPIINYLEIKGRIQRSLKYQYNAYAAIKNSSPSSFDRLGLDSVPCENPRSVAQCCRDMRLKMLIDGDMIPHGLTFCCDGRLVACSFYWLKDDNGGLNDLTEEIIGDCITRHEVYHANRPESLKFQCPCECGLVKSQYKDRKTMDKEECKANKITVACLKKAHDKCKQLPVGMDQDFCVDEVDQKLESAERNAKDHCERHGKNIIDEVSLKTIF